MDTTFICDDPVAALECKVCLAKFPDPRVSGKRGRNPKFCSGKCRKAEAVRWHAEWHKAVYDTAKRAEEYRNDPGKPFICKHCGETFVSKQGKAFYCPGKGCMEAALSAMNITRPTLECQKCGSSFKPSKPNQKQRANGHVQRFCSWACAGIKRTKGANRKKRTKELRAHGYMHPVNPIKVFERDGWKCHLCGEPTPKRLRGTTDDRAPELDHIVTIAEGGEHSYENTACACRRCNRKKGSKSLGQLLLFG